jgi:ring-1,2-phenylacetyl-CoA epoxidase subunit PaaC
MNELDIARFRFMLRQGDSCLILGHRLSEWCGHGPFLEEDISLINISLDLIGRSRTFLTYAGEIEGKGRTEDDLAYLRNEREFLNMLIIEQPNGDFGYTIARQFLFDAFSFALYQELTKSKDEKLAAIAEKSIKEITYHLRHSREWVLRLGDGTEESKQRIQSAFDELWRFTGDMFDMNASDELLVEAGIIPDLKSLKTVWHEMVSLILAEATLNIPADAYMHTGSKNGIHTEHLGFLLAEMQHLTRAFPGAKW